jgi:hypothetical protein
MAATIPSLTEKIDSIFTSTWYEMQAKATDNILQANVISAALKEAGCFKTQVGGKYIERTIRYGKKTAITVAQGDTMPTGEEDLETAAYWKWKYMEMHVQRALQEDQQNTGSGAIKSLVQTKIEAARDALADLWEASMIAPAELFNGGAAGTTAPTLGTERRKARDPYSLFNLFDSTGATATYHGTSTPSVGSYTYGGIDLYGSGTTGNYWWIPQYTAATNPALLNLQDQMRTMYNNCAQGGSDTPDLIITNQTLYEAFEDSASGSIQLVADVGSQLAHMGYTALKYKGAKLVWTPAAAWPTGAMAFLNTKWIDVIYDPNLWFTMMPWYTIPNQFERITRIVCATPGVICYQPRRCGLLTSYTA